MLGSILGDIVGSRFEFMSTQEKEVRLFHPACSWTDDTLLTYAVSKVCSYIIQNNILDENEIEALFANEFKKIVKAFPMAGWGKSFQAWSKEIDYSPNNSAANGCLMRLSPIILYFDDLETMKKISKICTKVTHNDIESYKAVNALVEILFYLKKEVLKESIVVTDKDVIEGKKKEVKKILLNNGYELESVNYYHQTAGYWGLAKDTLPRSVSSYLEGTSFENVMKNILFIGSDTDTTATIAGSMSEMTYSLNADILNNIYRYYDHISFNIIKEIIKPYFLEKNSLFLNNLYEEKSQFKLREILTHNPIDPTAQWDPLELPSDDEYYHLKPGFSWKKVKVKIHNLLNFRW